MRKVLILALVSMFFTTMACNKSEETPASPEASASMAPSEEAKPGRIRCRARDESCRISGCLACWLLRSRLLCHRSARAGGLSPARDGLGHFLPGSRFPLRQRQHPRPQLPCCPGDVLLRLAPSSIRASRYRRNLTRYRSAREVRCAFSHGHGRDEWKPRA